MKRLLIIFVTILIVALCTSCNRYREDSKISPKEMSRGTWTWENDTIKKTSILTSKLVIIEKETTINYHKTWFDGAQKVFSLEVQDPSTLNKAKGEIRERAIRIGWIIVLIICIIISSFFMSIFIDVNDWKMMTYVGMLTLLFLLLAWVFLGYLYSLLLTVGSLILCFYSRDQQKGKKKSKNN